ncbi:MULTISPECIES: cupin-like domain-containing protein [Sphingobium]|uniref:JmjC domain-containing protein n=1 Tax=Sphingobium fuliginis (strain ATCC 27551) TaxID=336203 RepID=A0ABQ1FAJ0_SPHSA|nr:MULTISPECIES: cupin-like domain-containing protein [Sphingobium]OAP31535.1 transcriptional regulator [Sphingobium sp. 20006FA]AJR24282.1 transcriptional regulator [Sphingobium sp. YBL2]KXU30331.1 transcriptional regulator [Sphingobium sp. AM]KYC30133.1 transcriptional regulator [Sphingobium sp. 22B]RYL99800.1 transcriptional regulator [Sphingobium fuliginis]
MNAVSAIEAAVFPEEARAAFAAAYPDRAAKLSHGLAGHALLTLEALAGLAERMPAASVEYNLGKLPLGVRAEDTPSNGLTLGETIRTIETNGSWAVLKNVERDADYGALLDRALAELAPLVERETGPMLHREAFIFLSSPGSVTPFHMDPEHNILLQIRGEKTMTVFPAGDEELVPAVQSEAFHAGGHRNLDWRDGFRERGMAVTLLPGDAIHVPVKAPHFVENGPVVSVSLSVTWRSERSVAEGELHSLNALLRRRGLPVGRIGARPEAQGARRIAYRIMRKLGV